MIDWSNGFCLYCGISCGVLDHTSAVVSKRTLWLAKYLTVPAVLVPVAVHYERLVHARRAAFARSHTGSEGHLGLHNVEPYQLCMSSLVECVPL
jgi:hypothetical protein